MGHLAAYERMEISRPETRATWRAAVDSFLDVRSKSPHTRRAYARDLAAAFEAMGQEYLAAVTPAALARYAAQHLRPADGNAPRASQARRMAALRAFLRWASRPSVGLWPYSAAHIEDALEMRKAPVRRPYQILDDEEAARMIEAAGSSRNRAVVTILMQSAARVSELAALDVADIQPEADGSLTVRVSAGKGGKAREIPVAADARPILCQHLSKTGRSLRSSGPLFPGPQGEALSTRTLWGIVTEAAQAAGIPKRISPHSLRHGYAVRYLRGGGTVPELQEILGHASLASTMPYTRHARLDELRAKVPGLPVGVAHD